MGIIEYHRTFQRFNDNKRLLDWSQCFKLIETETMSAMLPKSWKKLSNRGVVIPTKMRFCNECSDRIICDRRDNQISENKELKAKLNLLKRQALYQIDPMLPYYK